MAGSGSKTGTLDGGFCSVKTIPVAGADGAAPSIEIGSETGDAGCRGISRPTVICPLCATGASASDGPNAFNIAFPAPGHKTITGQVPAICADTAE